MFAYIINYNISESKSYKLSGTRTRLQFLQRLKWLGPSGYFMSCIMNGRIEVEGEEPTEVPLSPVAG